MGGPRGRSLGRWKQVGGGKRSNSSVNTSVFQTAVDQIKDNELPPTTNKPEQPITNKPRPSSRWLFAIVVNAIATNYWDRNRCVRVNLRKKTKAIRTRRPIGCGRWPAASDGCHHRWVWPLWCRWWRWSSRPLEGSRSVAPRSHYARPPHATGHLRFLYLIHRALINIQLIQ